MKRITNWLHHFIEKIGMVFLVLMLLIVSMQVLTRLTIKTTPIWAEEVSTMLMVWFGFLGMAIGVKERIHITITYFADSLPPLGRKIIAIVNEILLVVVGSALLLYGARLVYATRTSTLPATQWPAFMPYLMVPVAGFMIVIYTLVGIDKIFSKNTDINAKGLEG